MLFTKRIVRLLNGPVGNNLKNNEEDVQNLKNMLSYEGRYRRPVENGIIDRELNNSIFSFQRDNDLKVDGRVNPGGETEATLASTLILNNTTKPRTMQFAAAAPVAIPAAGAGIAKTMEVLGAIGAAMWGTLDKDEREEEAKKKEQEQEKAEDEARKEQCDDEYDEDTASCNDVTATHGKRAGAVCHKSATERYSHCLAERNTPYPPLQDRF